MSVANYSKRPFHIILVVRGSGLKKKKKKTESRQGGKGIKRKRFVAHGECEKPPRSDRPARKTNEENNTEIFSTGCMSCIMTPRHRGGDIANGTPGPSWNTRYRNIGDTTSGDFISQTYDCVKSTRSFSSLYLSLLKNVQWLKEVGCVRFGVTCNTGK